MTAPFFPDDPAYLADRLAVMTRLVDVSFSLNSTLALDSLLRYIMDAAQELASAEAASILLIDKNTRDLVFTAGSSSSVDDLIGKPVPLEGSIAGLILKEDRAVAINDVRAEPRHYRQLDEQVDFHTRSLLGVPMRSKDDVIGVLEVVNRRDGQWTTDDERTLTILAAQAAVAIENARLVAALRQAYMELEEVDELKNDFIAIASHELRTPLGVILGYASFLKDDVQGESAEHVETVFRSALQLREIIEQMVNLRYLKSGQMPLDREVVDLRDLLAILENDCLALAQAKNHRFTVTAPPQPLPVFVDANKLGVALDNLIHNAVKFTPEGGAIRVAAVARPTEAWVSVQDSGIGIPEEFLPRIFDEFFQVEDHMTRRHGGMGLGLSIAKALVEAHGGRLWVESAGAGQGSTFTISLPLAQV